MNFRLVIAFVIWLGAIPVASAQQTDSSVSPATPSKQPPFVPAADGGLGSTMTLEQQKAPMKQREEKATKLRITMPAGEPVPALKYQFWPARSALKPGSAQQHFFRALTLLPSQTPVYHKQLEALSSPDGDDPDMATVRSFIDTQTAVLNELHTMALSEVVDMDHHIRDLSGIELYSFLLPDVQQARTLARLLRLRALEQLDRRDFEGAVSTISDGYRLSSLIATGETLIEQLVAIAIASIMEDTVDRAIQTPGCPNLYWALASLPRPISKIRDSVQFEMHFLTRLFPLLADAEHANYPEEVWRKKWVDSLEPLGKLTGDSSNKVSLALAMATVGFVEPARQRLLGSGFSAEKLENMPPTQIVIIDTARELRRLSDESVKAYLLPIEMRKPLMVARDRRFQQWVQEERWSSGGAMVASVFFPAISQVHEAEVRKLMTQQRLMTVEALRMHAATHEGKLPESLDQLDPVPAMPDPYTGKPFGYRVESIDGRAIVILTADVPASAEMLREYRIQIDR